MMLSRFAPKIVQVLAKKRMDILSSNSSLIPKTVISRRFSEFYSPLPKDRPDRSPEDTVFEIVLNGSPNELKELFDGGVDPNIQNKDLRTPLMVAAEQNRLEMVDFLLEYGVNVNVQDYFGDTALSIAARENNKASVARLMTGGAQTDTLNYEGMTPVDHTMDEDIDTHIRMTRDHGKDPTTASKKDKDERKGGGEVEGSRFDV